MELFLTIKSQSTGPLVYKGTLDELAENLNTNHQAIIHFKGKLHFTYHNGGLAANEGSFDRSVCVDHLFYSKDGRI